MEYLMGLTTSPYVEWLQVRLPANVMCSGTAACAEAYLAQSASLCGTCWFVVGGNTGGTAWVFTSHQSNNRGRLYLQTNLVDTPAVATHHASFGCMPLQEGEVWAAIVSEIQCESAQVAKFLIDREIEAPERYSAVQSYRVAMAVLRQQRLFVEVSTGECYCGQELLRLCRLACTEVQCSAELEWRWQCSNEATTAVC